MNKDEALRLALEALEDETSEKYCPAITAIKAALEAKDEPWEQFYPEMGKPKLVEVQEGDVGITRYADISVGKITHNSPSTQRTWVGLTGEEIEASKPTRSNDAVVWELAIEWAEAKLKEKNT